LDAVQLSFVGFLSSNIRIPWASIDAFRFSKQHLRRDRIIISHNGSPDTFGRTEIQLSSHESSLALLAVLVSCMKTTMKARIQEWGKLLSEEPLRKPTSCPVAFVPPDDASSVILCCSPPVLDGGVEIIPVKEIARRELARELKAWPQLLGMCKNELYSSMTKSLCLHAYVEGAMMKLVLYPDISMEAQGERSL